MMKRVLLLFAALLLLLMADAAMHDVVDKKHTRKLAQGFGGGRIPETRVFYVENKPHPDHIADVANEPDPDHADVANDVGANKNNTDDDDENLGYKNYGKGSDTETHRYFSSDKPYRP